MNALLERILREPELRNRPPVLVDVGAAGGTHPAWSRIARHSIGVGFEPDARERAPLAAAQRRFRQWILCPGIASPTPAPGGVLPFHLTRSPQCSSVLPPHADGLREWIFAGRFAVLETRQFPAVTLQQALENQGLDRIDWLKCDTQGLDLKLYASLPEAWRARMLLAEFEPGFLDAYRGEDHVGEVLRTMQSEPFWLSGFEVIGTPRGRAELLAACGVAQSPEWIRRLASRAPGWANLQFQRDVTRRPEALDRRAWLLAWVFATLTRQFGQAVTVATEGARRWEDSLFRQMAEASVSQLRWDMLRNFPARLWRRLIRPA